MTLQRILLTESKGYWSTSDGSRRSEGFQWIICKGSFSDSTREIDNRCGGITYTWINTCLPFNLSLWCLIYHVLFVNISCIVHSQCLCFQRNVMGLECLLGCNNNHFKWLMCWQEFSKFVNWLHTELSDSKEQIKEIQVILLIYQVAITYLNYHRVNYKRRKSLLVKLKRKSLRWHHNWWWRKMN